MKETNNGLLHVIHAEIKINIRNSRFLDLHNDDLNAHNGIIFEMVYK